MAEFIIQAHELTELVSSLLVSAIFPHTLQMKNYQYISILL